MKGKCCFQCKFEMAGSFWARICTTPKENLSKTSSSVFWTIPSVFLISSDVVITFLVATIDYFVNSKTASSLSKYSTFYWELRWKNLNQCSLFLWWSSLLNFLSNSFAWTIGMCRSYCKSYKRVRTATKAIVSISILTISFSN